MMMQGDYRLEEMDMDAWMAEVTARREEEERKRAMRGLGDVLRARRGDEEAAGRVENSAYSWLNNPNWNGRDEEWYAAVGRETAAAHGVENPALLLGRMEEMNEKKLHEAGYADGFASGRGDSWSKDDYYEQIGRLMGTLDDVARREEARADADSAALERYAKGGSATDDKYIWSDWIRLQTRLSGSEQGRKMLENARVVHELVEKHYAPAFEKAQEDASEGLRMLDELEDETLKAIGDDPERAAMVREVLLTRAQELSAGNKVGVGDEFVVAVGKKLSNWGRFVKDKPTTLGYMVDVGLMGAGVMPPMIKTGSQIERDVAAMTRENEETERKSVSRGLLREAVNAAMEKSETVGFWKGMLRSVAAFGGDTLPYFVPYVGMAVGTADQVVGGMTETYDVYRAQGLSPEEAAGQSLIDTTVNATVELLPFSEVGGAGLSRLARWAMKGKPGALARGIARATQTSVGKALAWEAGVGFIDEAVLEPIAGGLMQYGAEQLFDFAGWQHDKSKAFADCFGELKQIWTDPQQLAGLVVFSGMVASGGAPHVIGNVRYFQANRNLLYSRGLSEAEIDTAMASENAALTAARMEHEKWQRDPEGMKKVVLERNEQLKQNGQALVYAGLGTMAQGFDARLNEELGHAWSEYAQAGVLPLVEEGENGKIKITERVGGQEQEFETDETAADYYLSQRIAELEKQELERVRRRVKSAPADGVSLRAAILDKVSRRAGAELLEGVRESAERSGISVASLTEGLPAEIAGRIETKGYVDWTDAQAISEYGMGQVRALMEGGLSEAQARGSRAAVMGGVRVWGDVARFAESFAHRAKMAGLAAEDAATSVYRANGEEKVIDGEQVAGQVIFAVPGAARGSSVLEDTAEAVLSQMVAARARELAKDGDSTPQEAQHAAWQEMADIVSRARAAVVKADKGVKVEEVRPGDRMSVVEAFSTMATSRFMDSEVMPEWMRGISELSRGVVQAADALGRIKLAYAAAMEQEGDAMREMDELLGKVGVKVQSVFARAHAEARVQVAEAVERVKYADAPGRSAAEVVEEVQQETAAIEEREKNVPEPTVTQQEYTRDVQRELEEMEGKAALSGKWKDVFVDGRGMRHPIGGYMLGLVDKSKIAGQIEQVKRGEKGERGTMAGRRLKGDFQGDAGALYLWLRKDGSLWLISGRHRYDLLMQDEKMPYHVAYVYEEDAAHNETWARMLDYENNMRDDQADELTAATYVREMKPTDEKLYSKGLTRNESRSARGVYIGRQAGQFLWDLFNNGLIKGKRAAESVETICKMTEYIRDEEVKNNVQAMAAKLLSEGESWECINVCIQAMAADRNAPKEGRLRQGFLFFGKDFEEEMRQRGRYAARAIAALTEKINAGVGAAKAQKNAAAVAEMGYTVTRAEGQERYTLEELVALRERFRNMACDPELTEDALAWDGQSTVDPIERYITSRREELDARETEEERQRNLEAEEYIKEHMGSLFGGGEESFSMKAQARYRVVDDSAGLQQHLDKKVEPIEINFGELSESAMKAEWAEMGKGDEFKVTAYSREKITRELIRLAEVYPDYLQIGETGYRVQLPTSRTKAKPAAGRIRNAVKAQAVSGLLDVIKKAVHLNSTTPRVTASTGEKKKKAMVNIASYERFGYPVKLNGEDYVFWFNGTTEKKDSRDLQFYEFGLVDAKNKETEASRSTGSGPDTENAPVSERTLGDFLSNVKNKNVVNVEKVENSENPNMSLSEAKEQGMFKDGVLETGNAVITEPGVTYSIQGVQHASPHKFKKFDLEHIGSGEGQQVFGWGVYFSSNWGVNRSYHRVFRRENRILQDKNGENLPENYAKQIAEKYDVSEDFVLSGILWTNRDGVLMGNGDLAINERAKMESLKKELRKRKIPEYQKDIIREEIKEQEKYVLAAEELERDKPRLVTEAALSMNYLSDLEVEEHELLDWDNEANNVSVLRKMYGVEDGNWAEALVRNEDLRELVDRELHWTFGNEVRRMIIEPLSVGKSVASTAAEIRKNIEETREQMEWAEETLKGVRGREEEYEFVVKTCRADIKRGEEALRILEEPGYYSPFEGEIGERIYKGLVESQGSPKAASEWLLERGIKGIRYEDGASRGKDGEKTYNYVIFDPDVIQVKKVADRKEWSRDVEDADTWQDWESWKDSFSMFSPAEASGLHALKALAQGAKEARFRSDTLGDDVILPMGNAGALKNPDNPNSDVKGAHGFIHLISMRMAHGESLEEAAYTACKAVMAAVNGYIAAKRKNGTTLTLDGYNGVLIANWQDSENAWVITGFKQNGEKSSADDRRRALHLAESYALDSFGGLKEVGAALDYAIARMAREYKQNNADPRRKVAKIDKLENEARESFSMKRAAELAAARKVNDILLGRAGEREGEAVMKQWGEWMERIARVSAAGESKSRLGRGVEALAGLVALIGATQSVLPERYKTPNLRVQMAFAEWYARMIETGSIEMSEELAGDKFYERYKARFAADVELQKSYGVDEEGAREYLADIVGGRFDGVMLNMARRCRKQVERFMKDRVRERMDALRARLYPKRKSGQAWPRGKADAETYRWVEDVYALMEHKDNEQGEPGDFEAETERLELLLEDLEQDGEGESEKAAELREQVHRRKVFGQWRKLSYEAAVVAGEEFETRVLEGRRMWEERLEGQRRHVAWLKEQVRRAPGRDRQWKLAGSAEAITEQVRESAQKQGRTKDAIRAGIGAFTSFAGKMKAWAPELGGVFAERMQRDWANMNIALKSRNDETLRFVQERVSRASGTRTLEGMAQWIREQSALEKTGIILHRKETKSRSYTADQARMWLGLDSFQEREAKRAELRRETEEQEITATIPTEEDIKRMRELYEQKPERKTYTFESEEEQDWELEASKMSMLQNILLFEQEQYRELWEVNGITEDVLARMREYIGADMLALGYALRDRLAEMRPELAAKYERTYGLPFDAVEKYYPARFLVESKGVEDEHGEVKKNKGGMPAKPGFLVPRQKHQRIADWGVSALDTFFGAAAAQNNWLVTSDFIGMWGALFADKKFAAELEVNCGKNFGAWVKADILTLAGAGMEDARLLSNLNRFISRVGRGMAITALSYNGTTIFKNTLSLLNGMTGARIPIVKLQESGAARVLSSRRIGWTEWLAGFAKGPFSVRDIARQEFIKVRSGLYSENLRRAAKEPAERKGKLAKVMPRGVGKLGQLGLAVQNAGMAPIEWADVGGNIVSCVAVANAVYNSLEKQDTQGVMSETQKRELALQYAAMCLDAVAQPFIASQKTTGAARRLIFGATGDVVQYMFKSEAMAKVSDAVADIATGTPSGIAYGVASLTLHGGAAVLMGALYLCAMRWIYALITGDEPEEEKDYWKKIATDAAFAGVYDVPLVGAGVEELVAAATGRRTYYSQNVLGNAVRAGGRLFDGEKEYSREKNIKDISTMLKATGQVGALFGNVRPISTLTELTLAAGAISNVPTKVAAGSGKKK